MTLLLKRQADHNPSMKVEDFRLGERQYLIAGPVLSRDGAAETQNGLWIPITQDTKLINTAKVLKVGPGCSLASVGEYVIWTSITGENFNHLKPQPVHRNIFDEGGLFTLGEECVRAVIPEAVADSQAMRECDGTHCSSEQGGQG